MPIFVKNLGGLEQFDQPPSMLAGWKAGTVDGGRWGGRYRLRWPVGMPVQSTVAGTVDGVIFPASAIVDQIKYYFSNDINT